MHGIAPFKALAISWLYFSFQQTLAIVGNATTETILAHAGNLVGHHGGNFYNRGMGRLVYQMNADIDGTVKLKYWKKYLDHSGLTDFWQLFQKLWHE